MPLSDSIESSFRAATAAAFAILLTGCAPEVRTTAFQASAPKDPGAPIRLFRLKAPECAFEELGIVNARQRNKFISMDEVLASLMDEARKLGGDAIVGLSESNPIHNVDPNYGVDRDPVLSGTVIRFSDPNCTR